MKTGKILNVNFKINFEIYFTLTSGNQSNETEKKYNRNCTWLHNYDESINASKDEFQQITVKDISDATTKFSNWKSAGVDNIQNF